MKGKLASCNLELISAYFDLDIQTAAQKIGVSSRSLKIACRKYGIRRWPFRRIRMVNKAIFRLHEQIDKMLVEKKPEMYEQLAFLQRQKEQLTRHGRPLEPDSFKVATEESGEESDMETEDRDDVDHVLSSGGEVALDGLDTSLFVGQSAIEEEGSMIIKPKEKDMLRLEAAQNTVQTQAGVASPSPAKITSRQITPTRAHAHIDFAYLSKFFSLTASTAAKQLGVSVTTLKKICREHGIARWPSRKIRKMSNALSRIKGICEGFPSTAVHLQNLPSLPSRLPHSPSSVTSSVSLSCSLPSLAADSPRVCSPRSSSDPPLSLASTSAPNYDLSVLVAVACNAVPSSVVSLNVPPKKRSRSTEYRSSNILHLSQQ